MPTRAQFVETAKIIASVKDDATRRDLFVQFAAMYARENPRFNRSRFATACNVDA